MRSDLKTAIFNSIHLWGVLPSAEERARMSAAEVKAFTAAAVDRLRRNKEFMHYGLDSNVSCSLFPRHIY